MVQRQVWIWIHQQEWHQGRCLCSPGRYVCSEIKIRIIIWLGFLGLNLNCGYWLILINFQTAIIKNNPKKAVRSVGDGEVLEMLYIHAGVKECSCAVTLVTAINYPNQAQMLFIGSQMLGRTVWQFISTFTLQVLSDAVNDHGCNG